jgi:ribosome biogenesis GTPase / thiamine phosphate phosphatase
LSATGDGTLLAAPERHRPAVSEDLAALGWDDAWAAVFAPNAGPGLEPGRVVATHRETSIVRCMGGDVAGTVSGRFRREAAGLGGYPAVGDWVVLQPRLVERSGTVHAVLPRRGVIARTAGDSNRRGGGRLGDEQVLAANVDVAFLVAAIDRPPNLRRLERYLALAWGGGAIPVVLLNKSDESPDVEVAVSSVRAVAPGAEVLALSALTGAGLERLRPLLGAARTLVFLGPSGVGKSTLVNALLGEARQATAAVREGDARGRHTTTHREIIPLPGGALLVDTPGIRSLELLDGDEGLGQVFTEVAAVVASCRFTDCAHDSEPGCAVRPALADGRLDRGRWASYQKLRREVAHEARKSDPRAREAERRRWRAIHAEVARQTRRRYGEGP